MTGKDKGRRATKKTARSGGRAPSPRSKEAKEAKEAKEGSDAGAAGNAWRFFAVDRLEGRVAVLVDDDARAHDVPVDALPRRPREGAVLRVGLDARGAPVWSSARRDDEERERRMRLQQERLGRLKGSDPGGDVSL